MCSANSELKTFCESQDAAQQRTETSKNHVTSLWLVMADFNSIAKQFTEFYYNTFDTNRANLASLYVCIFKDQPDRHLTRLRGTHLCSALRAVLFREQQAS